LQERFGDRLGIERRAFPLRPGPDRSVTFRGTKREASWRHMQSMVEPEGMAWKMWDRDDYPHWSLPALEAAKCAALQSQAAFEDLHFRLFRGFFEHGVNIANLEELLTLVRQAPLDYSRFVEDFDRGVARRAVLDDYEEAVNTHMIYAIPTVMLPDGERVVGAVPMEE
jgi:predicted DsbA family dithiol-disulfide isomerase